MYFLLSPAKSLNEQPSLKTRAYTQPELLNESKRLISVLRTLAPHQLADLMRVSDKIALLNVERFARWHTPFTPENAKAAIDLFNGDVYEGIDIENRSDSAVEYMQHYVRILSGLYGILRPLDLIQAYRLEMGTALLNPRGKNLYDFWGSKITDELNRQLQENQETVVVNLASQEYFKAIQSQRLNARIITPIFQDEKNGQYKIISFYAKRARGLMIQFAAEHAIKEPEQLKDFDWEGYQFQAALSSENQWVFQRRENAH